MAGDLNEKLQLGHIKGQAISYFVFALLFLRSYSVNIGSNAPFFSLDTSGMWSIPVPNFHVGKVVQHNRFSPVYKLMKT